jgi:DNA-binding SARP family transcriptional activator
VEFGRLGPVDVSDSGRSMPLGGAKQRALLADLLIHANEVVSVDRLIDDLWGETLQRPR